MIFDEPDSSWNLERSIVLIVIYHVTVFFDYTSLFPSEIELKKLIIPIDLRVIIALPTFKYKVGVDGLEPSTSASQTRRAPNCATPRYPLY